MAGGIVSNASYTPAMLAFMLPAVLPAIATLVTRDDLTQNVMGVLLVNFAIVMIVAGRSIHQSIVENFWLRSRQDALLAKVLATEAAMAEAQATTHVGSWEQDLHTGSITLSPEIFRILAVDPATFKPTFAAIMARIHPDDRPMVEQDYAKALATGAGSGLDHRIVRDDGTVRSVYEIVRTAYDATGLALRVTGTVQDITERKQGEAAKSLLASIVESSVDAIVGETVTGIITSWNRGAEDLFGYRADEVIGKNVRMLVPEDRREQHAETLLALAQGVRIEPFDSERLRKDQSLIPVSVAASSVRDPAGNVAGGSFISRDISERTRAASALSYRDRLLHAVNVGMEILVKAETLELGMPAALRTVGECMRVERVVLMQEGSPPVLRYLWQGDNVSTPLRDMSDPFPGMDSAALRSWRAPMKEGKPVIAQMATSEGAVCAMLRHFQSKSILLVPILLGGKMWGNLGTDSCSAREWDESEIDTMKTFGDIAGSLILHDERRLALERSEERFRAVSATAQDAIITIDGAARISFWNGAAERILGYSSEEAVGQQVHEFLAPARFRQKAGEGMKTFISTGAGGAVGKTTQLAAIRKDGTEIAIEISLAGARLGGDWQAVGILRDVTARTEMENKLQLVNILLRTQMEASPDGILVVDLSRRIISFNQRFADMWQIPMADLKIGNDATTLTKVTAAMKDPQAFLARVEYLHEHPAEESQEELQTTGGRFIERHSLPLNTAAGDYLGRAWFFRDITQSKLAAAQAVRIARYDGLTGLANRSVFVEALQNAVARAKRGEKGFAVIYLDLDHFKDVNDTLGHPVGDALLEAVADRLRSNTRASDTLSRFGGDEFAVIVGEIRDPSDASVLANKLIDAMGDPYLIQGNVIYSGASIGIDIYGPEASDAETLLSHADVALYRAKSEGRGGCRFFTDAMEKLVRAQVSLGTELHTALETGQFFLMYQPQVAIDTGRITGVEALVRWRHPMRGVLDPDSFIPVAEKIGIIAKLGHWVMLTACGQAKTWLDGGIPSTRMAVNVTSLQFRTPVALENDIAAILAQTGLPPQVLELEITESVLMDVSRERSEVLQRIRKTGVTVAIDDFGTGYSSLDYLRRFPSDRIKIAQTFVKHLEAVPGDAAIVRATISLARELGIAVIAEGIETAGELELLKGWGCAEAQGFHFAPPLTAENAAILLRRGETLPLPPSAAPAT
jgi:diguanylate cyclase (GGDEF)-like protein/PAS domain S-box-containing protein